MSERIAVVTDNSCSLTDTELSSPLVTVVDISILADNKKICSTEELHQAFSDGLKITTASPGVAVFERMYQSLLAEGFTQIFSVHMSDKLSSTYQHASMASLLFDGKVHVYDSRTAGFAQGKIVLRVLEMIERGSTRYEITHYLENAIPDTVILLPRTIESLKQGGRVKAGAALVAQLFQITPWGKIEDGKLLYAGRAKSFDDALEAIFLQNINQEKWPRAAVLQIDPQSKYESSEKLQQLLESYEGRDIPPVLLAHTGPGALGIVVER